MPNVIHLLNTDHREVEELFAEFESTQDPSIALKICDELTVHATVEEEIVYPVLAQIDREVEQEAEDEHDDAKRLIARIRSLSPDDPSFVPTVLELKKGIEHHVSEEEGEAWDRLRAGAGDRLESMGARVEARKQELTGVTMPSGAGTSFGTGSTEVRGSATTDFSSMTRDELYELAKERKIAGRSNMKKAELVRALSH
jgi:hypothetical protein